MAENNEYTETTDDVAIPPMEEQVPSSENAGADNDGNVGADNDAKETVAENISAKDPSSDTSSKPVPTDLTTETAWKEISHDSPPINWYLFAVDKKMDLVFKKAGNDGFAGFTDYLKNASGELLFGLLRVNSNDRGGSKRAKFVFVRFVGSSVNIMQKAKLTPKLGKIGDSFPVKHMTYDLTEDLGNFTIESLAREMLRVGGAHKPDSYDFGPNQIYQCK